MSTAFQKEVIEACQQTSRLDGAAPAGRVIGFDDQVGMAAVVIDGTTMVNRRKSRPARVLCLFDKVTRKAFVTAGGMLIDAEAAQREARLREQAAASAAHDSKPAVPPAKRAAETPPKRAPRRAPVEEEPRG